jgi:hypothetical protein
VKESKQATEKDEDSAQFDDFSKGSRFIRWLRIPSSFAVRLAIAILLILGGIFSFLPVLGVWMLPLGLLLIAQDVPLLQKPLVAAFAWVERRCEWLRVKWRDR